MRVGEPATSEAFCVYQRFPFQLRVRSYVAISRLILILKLFAFEFVVESILFGTNMENIQPPSILHHFVSILNNESTFGTYGCNILG